MNQKSAGLPKEITNMLGEAAGKRAVGWRCLAQGFQEPTAGLPNDSYLAALDQAVSWLDSDRERFQASLEATADFLRSAGGRDPTAVLQDLKAEYARLFLGPEPRLAPPYESMYRDRESPTDSPTASGPSTEAVRNFYLGTSWPSAPSPEDLPDHVATECDFLYYLCQQEADAWQRGDDQGAKEYRLEQHRFLHEHLSLWLPDLCDGIQSVTRSKFYWGLTDFARLYLSIESGSEDIFLTP